MWEFIYGFSILFHYLYVNLMPVSHGLDYYRFVVSFEIEKCASPTFVLFQDNFGYPGSLILPQEF